MPNNMEPDLELNDPYYYRFSNGMWTIKESVEIDWATEVAKKVSSAEEFYALVSTKKINHRGDTLNTTTITTQMSSPSEGIVSFEATHFKGIALKEPRFNLNKSKTNTLNIASSDKITTVSSGDLRAEYSNDPFGVDFIGTNDKLLTKLGFRSLGYVRDSRAGGDKPEPFMTAQLHLSVGEKIYGLGERFGPFIKNGQSVEMWNRDGGTSSEQTYKNVPFFISNRGYGVFVEHTNNVCFEVQSERTTRVNIVVPGEKVRFHIINGPTPKDILRRYTQLTGAPALPPPWTFGLWLSTSFTTEYDYSTVSSFIQGMKDREIPLHTFHFDCFWMKGFEWCNFEFDKDYFPDAKKILSDLKKNYNVRICVWINPYIGQESKLFDEGAANGYFIKKTDGSVWQTDMWQAGMGVVDFTNPKAWEWYQGKLKALLDIGVDCFKTDFGERIPAKNVTYFDGSDPIGMHNYYSFVYNKCVFELLQKERGTHEACLFARSATAGGQQFPVHWGGDCESTFEAMAETVRGGLSLTTSGFGFWSHDIGGFEGSPDADVYKRWVAFGLLSSHSRLHGSGSYRVPWNFDDEACDVLRKFTQLKCSLMPYIYAQALNSHAVGTPVMRALYFEFPEQDEAWMADTQYMLGPNLLVAPVFEGKSGEVRYFVPKGEWYGYLDGKIRQGQGYVSEIHDFMSVPLLVRSDSITVSGGENTKPDYDYAKDFTVNVFNLATKQTAELPDFKSIGKVVGTVTAEPIGDNEWTVSTSGKTGAWSVKVLGGKDVKSVSGGAISGKDEFNNTIVKASSSKVTITF
ncbi:hypothetical protein TRVA0_001S02146 [Trichomonascus vanleenenianus]|uniref:uncharacterized protein n=1 Tax=Trichomonascus vanleenenianus TaxID=2268995 RepID=UPI003ECB718B